MYMFDIQPSYSIPSPLNMYLGNFEKTKNAHITYEFQLIFIEMNTYQIEYTYEEKNKLYLCVSIKKK